MMLLSLCCLLLAAIAHQAEGRVDNDFERCSQYFYNGEMPSGFEKVATEHGFSQIPDAITNINDLQSPAYICQTLGGKSYYATLYDRGRRIPLYSAYILDHRVTSAPATCKRSGQFKQEPQLIFRQLSENMLPILDTKAAIKTFYAEINKNRRDKITERDDRNKQTYVLGSSQAMDDDYRNMGYDKGHINPCGHHSQEQNCLSTFTMTNMVPMLPELNKDKWNKYEDKMLKTAKDKKCHVMYMVTGVVPGNNKMKDRVNIPSYVWSAHCCVNKAGTPITSGAGLVLNQKPLDNKQIEVKTMTVRELQDELKKLLGVSRMSIFDCACEKSSHCPTM